VLRPAPLLAVALALAACGRPPPPPPEPIEAGPGVTSLLGGLARGDALGPARVASVGALQKGRIPIRLTRDDARADIEVALKGDGPLPPLSTGKYAIFTSSPRPGTPALTAADLTSACEALAERIRAHEDKVPTPAGMTAYGAVSQEL